MDRGNNIHPAKSVKDETVADKLCEAGVRGWVGVCVWVCGACMWGGRMLRLACWQDEMPGFFPAAWWRQNLAPGLVAGVHRRRSHRHLVALTCGGSVLPYPTIASHLLSIPRVHCIYKKEKKKNSQKSFNILC